MGRTETPHLSPMASLGRMSLDPRPPGLCLSPPPAPAPAAIVASTLLRARAARQRRGRARRGGAGAGIRARSQPHLQRAETQPSQRWPRSLTCCLPPGQGSLGAAEGRGQLKQPAPHSTTKRNPCRESLREAAEPTGPGFESTGLSSLLHQTLADGCPLPASVSLSQRAELDGLSPGRRWEPLATEAASQPARVQRFPSVSTPCKPLGHLRLRDPSPDASRLQGGCDTGSRPKLLGHDSRRGKPRTLRTSEGKWQALEGQGRGRHGSAKP